MNIIIRRHINDRRDHYFESGISTKEEYRSIMRTISPVLGDSDIYLRIFEITTKTAIRELILKRFDEAN